MKRDFADTLLDELGKAYDEWRGGLRRDGFNRLISVVQQIIADAREPAAPVEGPPPDAAAFRRACEAAVAPVVPFVPVPVEAPDSAFGPSPAWTLQQVCEAFAVPPDMVRGSDCPRCGQGLALFNGEWRCPSCHYPRCETCRDH
jgi:hypothetical protein